MSLFLVLVLALVLIPTPILIPPSPLGRLFGFKNEWLQGQFDKKSPLDSRFKISKFGRINLLFAHRWGTGSVTGRSPIRVFGEMKDVIIQ